MEDERSVIELMQSCQVSEETVARVARLWGKSAARNAGRTHVLLGHLLDTAAVAGLMWDRFLSPAVRRRLDEISGGQGRAWFMWVCAIHDCGKACPAFQALDVAEAAPVRAAGLTWGRLPTGRRMKWRHDVAGGAMLIARLREEWGDADAVAWVWPLVAGHHGVFPSVSALRPPYPDAQGRGPAWAEAQRAVVDVVTRVVGFADVAAVRPVSSLRKAEQLALAGLIVMADWIASDSEHFKGLADAGDVSPAGACRRAEAAWERLGFRGGWEKLAVPSSTLVPLTGRLGVAPRASQRELVERAWSSLSPGLLVVEAPMGEGKTKAALAAAEVLAARFGLNGVFVAMPTQATSDPMYEQVLEWVGSFHPELVSQVALLHGKRRFNRLWRRIWDEGHSAGVGASPWEDYGAIDEDDEFGWPGSSGDTGGVAERGGPPVWFLGSKRGLLTPFAVGTIDHLLYAATRTRHVMLRAAGLVGKVVIVDEVHAADIYMRQFLLEALRWLGQAGVPVVLLSATLPPAQRQAFVDAYLSGVLAAADVQEPVPEPAGYPCITAAFAVGGQPVVESSRSLVPSWRESVPTRIEWLPDTEVDGAVVAAVVREAVAEGGVVLVVVNQVDRAQAIYRALRGSEVGGHVHLLHGRLCTAHRAERTEECLRLMGPRAGDSRPEGMVVIATQLAEQSFDVDADLLITDLAPVDLLLQRIGRLHRHAGTRRPAAHAVPRVLVTGVAAGVRGRPRFLPASVKIYEEWPLLRAAALVSEAAGPLPGSGGAGVPGAGVWSIPADVPGLVARAYGGAEVCPAEWDEQAAGAAWRVGEEKRRAQAEQFLLTRPREWGTATLEGLHYAGSTAVGEEDLDAVVRDGDRGAEVVLVHRVAGGYTALDGTRLGVYGEVLDDAVVERLLGGSVRLPVGLSGETGGLRALPGWVDHPWLRHARALVFEGGWAELGGSRVSYDDAEGLVVKRG
ncbi:CRISPR-associated helicase Cas3' [Streptomyces broussonetiae]|uniref:CRISPR-associated helicase Cas3 n=1 Tax=Streptomyces broussonetiae TaxID=2686304 RepID=A0A6I6MWU2_9ACTN|nr:CRISPR-associated helicase Cas3' [Streptomyces broussonetiae]QHA02070.1 CRISPR-associated helicase Cas3' [Streptomyces broussonetiae]